MLSDDIKLSIQTAYSGFLKKKGLSPRYGQRLMIAEIAKALNNITGVSSSATNSAAFDTGGTNFNKVNDGDKITFIFSCFFML